MYNKLNLLLLSIISVCANLTTAQEMDWTSNRPDGHAPIGIMGDHYHKQGEIMFSYKYMPMWMSGSLNNSKAVSDEDIYKNYMVSPQKMRMDMHMVGVMYAPSDYITLMAMGNYLSNSMDLKTKTGKEFSTESHGLGDISLSGLFKIMNNNKQSLHANIGISIPTGDIDRRGDMPGHMHSGHMHDNHGGHMHHGRHEGHMHGEHMHGGKNMPLAYPMQLGSGTWDPSVGITYLGQSDKFSWGAQSKYKFRPSKNKFDYKLGNRFDLVGWAALNISNNFSVSSSINYYNIGKIDGVRSDLNSKMMPLFNTANSGRSQMDIGLGANFYIPHGSMKNLRFGAEIKFPAYQNVEGIQMKNGVTAVFGTQYTIE